MDSQPPSPKGQEKQRQRKRGYSQYRWAYPVYLPHQLGMEDPPQMEGETVGQWQRRVGRSPLLNPEFDATQRSAGTTTPTRRYQQKPRRPSFEEHVCPELCQCVDCYPTTPAGKCTYCMYMKKCLHEFCKVKRAL